jgi:putative Holliday junction resolvase
LLRLGILSSHASISVILNALRKCNSERVYFRSNGISLSSPDGDMAERVLAIDYGERKVGLALSDPETGFVSGLPTLDRGALKEGGLTAAIAALVSERSVDRVLLGMPYSLDGSMGPAAQRVRAFRDRLLLAIGTPIVEWDERLTTEAARRTLRELGYSEKKMRGKLDQLSAVLMLEHYMKYREQRPPAGAS